MPRHYILRPVKKLLGDWANWAKLLGDANLEKKNYWATGELGETTGDAYWATGRNPTQVQIVFHIKLTTHHPATFGGTRHFTQIR